MRELLMQHSLVFKIKPKNGEEIDIKLPIELLEDRMYELLQMEIDDNDTFTDKIIDENTNILTSLSIVDDLDHIIMLKEK